MVHARFDWPGVCVTKAKKIRPHAVLIIDKNTCHCMHSAYEYHYYHQMTDNDHSHIIII